MPYVKKTWWRHPSEVKGCQSRKKEAKARKRRWLGKLTRKQMRLAELRRLQESNR